MNTIPRYMVESPADDSRVFATENEAQQHAYDVACRTGTVSTVTDLVTRESWEVYGEN
jgi:hypothetical protein